MSKKIEEIMKHNEDYAKSVLAETGEFTLTFIIHSESGFIPVVAPFSNDAEKRVMLRVVQALMIKNRAYAYSVIMESWLVVRKVGDPKLKGQVKDEPDRKDALIIQYIGYDQKIGKMFILDKTKDPIEYIEQEEPASIAGRFTELLPPQSVHANPLTKEQIEGLDMILKAAEVMCGMKVVEVPIEPEGATRGNG